MQKIAISLGTSPTDTAPAKVLPENTLLLIQERIAQAIFDSVAAEKSLSEADKAALLNQLRVKTSVGDNEITNHIDVTTLGINAATLKTILARTLSSHPLFKNIVDIPDAIEKTQILADMAMLRSQGVAIPDHFDNFFKRDYSQARAFDIATTSTSTSVRSWSDLSADQQTVFKQIIAGSGEASFKQLLANNILAKLRATNALKDGDDAAIVEATNRLSLTSVSNFYSTNYTLQSPEQLAHEKNKIENKAEQNVDEAALLASNPINRLAEADIKKVLAATMFQMLDQAQDVTLPNGHTVKPATLFPEIAGKVDMQRALSDIFVAAKQQRPELAAKMDEILAHDLFSEAQRQIKNEAAKENHAPKEPGKSDLLIALKDNHHNGAITRDLHITIPAQNYGQFLTNAEHLAGIKEVQPHGAHCGDNCEHAAKATHNDNGSPAPASAPIADEAAKTLPQPAVLQTPATQPQPAADNLNIATANDNAPPTPLIGAPAAQVEKVAPAAQKAVG